MGKSMHKGHYGHYTGNYKFSKDHAHTRVTKENYKATERDDAAHIDYLKRDIDYDAHHGHSDEKMTADEKHISKLAGDMKYDKEHHGSPAKNIVGAVGKAAKMAAKAAQGYNLSKIREQAKEAIKNMRLSGGGSSSTGGSNALDFAQMGSFGQAKEQPVTPKSIATAQALDKLQSGGSSNKKLDPRMKYGHEEFDYDIASDAGVFDKELSADRKIRRAQKRYRRKTK